MRLVHFSTDPIAEINKIPHDNIARDGRGWKPRGLWVSDESEKHSWSWWCAVERFRDVHLQRAYEITLAAGADVLFIRSPGELLEFDMAYGYATNIGRPDLEVFDRGIRWPCVADDYDGIIITPYQWDLRLNDNVFWYYTWDCASGCIWDPAAIESFREIPAIDFKKEEFS